MRMSRIPRRRSRSMGGTLGLAALIGLAAVSGPPQIKPADIDSFKKLIKPAPHEDKWQEIPWRLDLVTAVKEADAQGKPIMMWEMDGNLFGGG